MAIERVSYLLRNLEFPGSNLGPETRYPQKLLVVSINHHEYA
jgi:hypothetical protein